MWTSSGAILERLREGNAGGRERVERGRAMIGRFGGGGKRWLGGRLNKSPMKGDLKGGIEEEDGLDELHVE